MTAYLPQSALAGALLLLLVGPSCAASSLPRSQESACVGGEQACSSLAKRIARATARRKLLARAVEQEDAPRAGRARSSPVGAQVRGALELAARSEPPAQAHERAVRIYEEACDQLERAYLESELESSDAPSRAGPWRSDERRDVLGSGSVDAKLAAWQRFDAARPYVKFAVVRREGAGLEVRVGRLDVSHVDIAGGRVLSAGLLQSTVKRGKTLVVAVENTSGGYRPRPLRNRTTLAALAALGYLPSSAGELTVYDNPSGYYDHSRLAAR